jgi:hypothetical protein
MRMPQETWPAKIHPWNPAGKRKRGRPRRSWRDGITGAMVKRGMGAEDAQDRILGRRVLGRRRTTISTHIYRIILLAHTGFLCEFIYNLSVFHLNDC